MAKELLTSNNPMPPETGEIAPRTTPSYQDHEGWDWPVTSDVRAKRYGPLSTNGAQNYGLFGSRSEHSKSHQYQALSPKQAIR